MALSEVSGCEDVHVDLTWVPALTISGTSDALEFAFGDHTFLGQVDAAFTWDASGTVATATETQDTVLGGVAFIGDETWLLDGDLAAPVNGSTVDATPCTLTARMEAEQNPL